MASHEMPLQVFGETRLVRSLDQLRSALKHRHAGRFGAFWLTDAEGHMLGLFIRDQVASLYFMPEDGTEDLWSHSPSFTGANDAQVEFILENFQPDLLPADSVVSLEDGEAAFEAFFSSGWPVTRIEWKP